MNTSAINGNTNPNASCLIRPISPWDCTPRYFKLEFAFHRAKYQVHPRLIDPQKLKLKAEVVELRSQGWSFPAIARRLGISVGTAWNIANHQIRVHIYQSSFETLQLCTCLGILVEMCIRLCFCGLRRSGK